MPATAQAHTGAKAHRTGAGPCGEQSAATAHSATLQRAHIEVSCMLQHVDSHWPPTAAIGMRQRSKSNQRLVQHHPHPQNAVHDRGHTQMRWKQGSSPAQPSYSSGVSCKGTDSQTGHRVDIAVAVQMRAKQGKYVHVMHKTYQTSHVAHRPAAARLSKLFNSLPQLSRQHFLHQICTAKHAMSVPGQWARTSTRAAAAAAVARPINTGSLLCMPCQSNRQPKSTPLTFSSLMRCNWALHSRKTSAAGCCPIVLGRPYKGVICSSLALHKQESLSGLQRKFSVQI